MPQKLTNEIIAAAIEGFEAQKTRINAQIAELRAMLAGGYTEPTAATSKPGNRKRRKMSAAARKRIAEAQRKRWAAVKKSSALPSQTVTAKPKRKMSAAGRKAISEATKKRWALKRAEAAKAETATKKSARKTATKKASAAAGAQ